MWKIFPKMLCFVPRLLLIEGKRSQDQGLQGPQHHWSGRFGIPPASPPDKGASSASLVARGSRVWLVGFCRLIPVSPRLPWVRQPGAHTQERAEIVSCKKKKVMLANAADGEQFCVCVQNRFC